MAVGTLVRLFSVLSAECDELACRVEDMHRFLPDGAEGGSTMSGDLIKAAQDIDFVHQHLAELSNFLMLMAEYTPHHMDLDVASAAASIRLSDLRDRITGGEMSVDAGPVVRSGELELL